MKGIGVIEDKNIIKCCEDRLITKALAKTLIRILKRIKEE